MDRKHRAMKRLLTFALSVALTVTFIPTSLFVYAADDDAAGAAVVEKSVTDDAAKDAQKSDSVSEDTSKEITPAKEEPASKEEAKEEELSKDAPVSVNLVPVGDPKHHVTYNGKEQVLKHTSENPLYKFEYYIGGRQVSASEFPEGFTADIYTVPIKKGEKAVDEAELRGTNVGMRCVGLRASLTGSAPGYYIDQPEQGFNLYFYIDPLDVDVTITGKTEEITYDGEPHVLDMFEPSCDNDLYDFHDLGISSKPPTERNVGEYTTGTSLRGYIENTNENFNVDFSFVPGKLTIKPAPLTIETASDRTMVEPNSPKVFTCPKTWIEGLVGQDELAGVRSCVANGMIAINKVGAVENTLAEIDWGAVDPNNYEITYKLGTLTVFAEDEVQITIIGAGYDDKAITYDCKTHSVDGYQIESIDNPDFEDIYKHNGKDMIQYSGNTHVEGKDVGHYAMNLDADKFSINPAVDEARDFKVTFVITDGGLTIKQRPLTVDVWPNNETHTYTGKEISMRAFNWAYPGSLEEVGYRADDVIGFDGEKVIKGTDVGKYTETLTLDKFHNLDKNYDVTFNLTDGILSPLPHKGKTEAVTELTSTLEIVRPVVIVELDASNYRVDYDGKEHTLKVDAASNKALFDGVVQEGNAFTVKSVINESNVPFDESKIYLRSDINLSGTDTGTYRERAWAKRLSYDDPGITVEFVALSSMALRVNPKQLTLKVDDVEITYEGKGIDEYRDKLTAHYEGLSKGETGPEYELSFKGWQGEDVPVTVFESYDIGARILSDSENYDITVEPGTFTVLKRPVTVTVAGRKAMAPYVERDGIPRTQAVRGYDISCDDELYNCDWAIEVALNTEPYAERAEVGQTNMGLNSSNVNFRNHDNAFDVTLNVVDGYIKIVPSDTERINIGTVDLEGGKYTYDGEHHRATLKKDTVTVGEKTYSLEARDIRCQPVGGGHFVDEDLGPVDAGEYTAELGNLRVFDGDVDVTSLCNWTRGEAVSITIDPRPIIVEYTGIKHKRVYRGSSIWWKGEAYINIYDYETGEANTTGYFDGLAMGYLTYDGTSQFPSIEAYGPGKYRGGLEEGTFTEETNPGTIRNNNPNYIVKEYVLKDCYLEVVTEDDMIALAEPTPVNEEFTYDGVTYHQINRNFKENKNGMFEIVADDGDTYNVRPYYPTIVGLDRPVKDAGVYTWYRTLSLGAVFDQGGYDVTDLASGSWPRKTYSGTLTIKPASADVTVKGDVSKTYGDPDPDTSTWVDVKSGVKNADRAVLSRLIIDRVPGEDVGRYEIRVSKLEALSEAPGMIEVGARDDEEEAIGKKSRGAISVDPVIEFEQPTAAKLMDNISVNLVDDGDKFFTINKAKLTITANDNSKDFGTEDPTLTATVSKGLVGSEALPKDFYSIYRDKGEDVKALPDYYTIHVDAPNEDVDWLEETHYFGDSVEDPIIDKPIEVSKEEASEKEYAEEAMAVEKEYAKEEVVYAAKAAKASKEYNPPEEEIDAPPSAEAEAGTPAEEAAPVKPEKPYYASSTEFKLKNYEVVTKNGKFNIVGKTAGDTSGNDSTSGATGGSSGGSDNGDDSSKTGDGFGLLETLALLTASLAGMLALVAIRRREQE